jgi:hypothetical protein
MRFELNLDVDLAALGRHLSGLLEDKPFTVQDHRVTIRRVDLRGEGSELILSAMLTGDASGQIEIRAESHFDPQEQAIRMRGLDFVFDPQDPEQSLMVNLFYQRIQQALQDGANELLAARTEGMRLGLESALSRSLPPDLKLDLSSLKVESLNLAVTNSSIRLSGAATGDLAVTMR